MANWVQTFKKLGPGLLFAGAAIGVSHLVASTKAGAFYGFGLLWAVLLANLMKYPFFEFGPRYAASTGETLLEGYKKLGNWAIIAIMALTVLSMFTIQATVTVVTAAIASILFDISLSEVAWSAIILGICMVVLVIGKYSLLDNLMKVIIVVLSIATILTVVLAIFNPVKQDPTLMTGFPWNEVGIGFLIILMGWMPAPLDLSVWSSIWSKEKQAQVGSKISLKESLFDFNVGYIGTVFLAICFVSLGALVVYGTGETIPKSGGDFARKLVTMYTDNLGAWSKPLIIAAALTTMFSTTLTCLDAFPRVLGRVLLLYLKPKPQGEGHEVQERIAGMAKKHFDQGNYWVWIFLVSGGALLLLYALGDDQMSLMVKIATVLSFVTAPLFAWINFRLITSKHTPVEARPPKWLIWLSWLGLVFLSGFTLVYVWVTFM